jgi:hypothetical protein
MKVDIKPYWKNITKYYWDKTIISGEVFRIWEILEKDYRVRRISTWLGEEHGNSILVEFPDEQTYTLFALRWHNGY